MLSRISEIRDPLGLCAGVLMTGKLLFQSVVRLKPGWDDSLEKYRKIIDKWNIWLEEMDNCKDIVISRSVIPSESVLGPTLKCEVVGFSDGSSLGFGCVLYLRWSDEHESKIDVKFLCAKGKVGLIGGNTVLRNELCGSLILSRITWSAINAFEKTETPQYFPCDCNVKLCIDSTIVMKWINSPAINFKPHVKNKVIEIQNLVASSKWNCIPSKKNIAADLLSKGCRREQLNIIIEGPELLRIPYAEWTASPVSYGTTVNNEENIASVVNPISLTEPIIDPNKFSNWNKLLRITSYVQRFIKLCRYEGQRQGTEAHYANPVSHEVDDARKYWIRWAQVALPLFESKYDKLVPFTDDTKNIVRVTGRLRSSHCFQL